MIPLVAVPRPVWTAVDVAGVATEILAAADAPRLPPTAAAGAADAPAEAIPAEAAVHQVAAAVVVGVRAAAKAEDALVEAGGATDRPLCVLRST